MLYEMIGVVSSFVCDEREGDDDDDDDGADSSRCALAASPK